jgi:hypothetical protein
LKNLRHRFLPDRAAGQNESHRHCRAQDRWQAALQLEGRKRQVEQSAGQLIH